MYNWGLISMKWIHLAIQPQLYAYISIKGGPSWFCLVFLFLCSICFYFFCLCWGLPTSSVFVPLLTIKFELSYSSCGIFTYMPYYFFDNHLDGFILFYLFMDAFYNIKLEKFLSVLWHFYQLEKSSGTY